VFGPAGLFSHFLTTRRGGSGAQKHFSSYGENYGRAYGYAYGGPADAPARRSRATKHKFALMSSLF
jgi:hypothetical protein